MDEDEVAQAASLILMRSPPGGGRAEILFVVRGAALRFGGGALAFPGGRVDPADAALAARYPSLDPVDAAARIAAVRETWEETGIAVGFVAPAGGDAFHEMHALPDLVAIQPFAHWRPPRDIARRFDTRFYVAEAPGEADPIADGTETASAFWTTADEVNARLLAGDGTALFPTRRLIERIAGFADAKAAASDPNSGVERAIEAWIERRADGDWLRIPDDAGYPITEERMAPGLRG